MNRVVSQYMDIIVTLILCAIGLPIMVAIIANMTNDSANAFDSLQDKSLLQTYAELHEQDVTWFSKDIVPAMYMVNQDADPNSRCFVLFLYSNAATGPVITQQDISRIRWTGVMSIPATHNNFSNLPTNAIRLPFIMPLYNIYDGSGSDPQQVSGATAVQQVVQQPVWINAPAGDVYRISDLLDTQGEKVGEIVWATH